MKTSGFQEKVLLFFNRSLVLITKKLNPQRIDLENRAGVAGPPASVRTPARRAFPPEPHTRTRRADAARVGPCETLGMEGCARVRAV